MSPAGMAFLRDFEARAGSGADEELVKLILAALADPKHVAHEAASLLAMEMVRSSPTLGAPHLFFVDVNGLQVRFAVYFTSLTPGRVNFKAFSRPDLSKYPSEFLTAAQNALDHRAAAISRAHASSVG